MRNFNNFDWADSELEKILIEFDIATIEIWNDTLNKRLSVICSGLAGITNLCIWDDTAIMKAEVLVAENDDFVCQLYSAYTKYFDYGGRSLNGDLLQLKIELSNHICFSVYCHKVDVSEGIE